MGMPRDDHPVDALRQMLNDLARHAQAVTGASTRLLASTTSAPPTATATEAPASVAKSWLANGTVTIEQVLSDASSLANLIERLLDTAEQTGAGNLRPGLAILDRNLVRAVSHARGAAATIESLRSSLSESSSDDALASVLDDLLAIIEKLPDQLQAAGDSTRQAIEAAGESGHANLTSLDVQRSRNHWRQIDTDVAAIRANAAKPPSS